MARNLQKRHAMVKWVSLAVPFVLCLATPALASVVVLPVKGTNIEPGAVDAIGEMLTNAYQAEAKESAIGPAESAKALEEAGSYQAATQKLGAREYVYVTAVRLDTHIVLSATLYGADGHYIYSAKMTATSLDDIEAASERLAKALIHQQTALDARTVDTVTRTEQGQPIRVAAQKVAGFKGSFTYPIGYGHDVAPQASVAFDLRLENANQFIEIGFGLTFAAPNHDYGYGGISADIGGDFYLMKGSTAPYLGLGVMPRVMGESLANVAPYGQFGVMFARESTTRFYTDFRIAQNLLAVNYSGLDKLDPATGMYVEHSNKGVYPTELTFSIGMGF